MEIDNYRNFLAIVEAGSMTAASEYIHIAQPALSKQVKSLENYFGTKLIITTRGSKHLILTDAGRILYHKAKYICSLEDMAKNEIGDVSDGSKGTLRFTVANSRAAVFIKECLEPFHRLFPLINYEIHEGGITEQSQQLLSGIAELGILSVPPIHQNNFDVLFRRKEKIVCVTAENSMFLKGTPYRRCGACGMSALSLHRLSSHDVEDLRGEIHPPADPFHLYHAYHRSALGRG